jgi:hypothetical protein
MSLTNFYQVSRTLVQFNLAVHAVHPILYFVHRELHLVLLGDNIRVREAISLKIQATDVQWAQPH